MNYLNEEQLIDRAVNKIHAKIFFAKNKLREIDLEIQGIIPSKLCTDILERNYLAQHNEVAVLEYIMSRL